MSVYWSFLKGVRNQLQTRLRFSGVANTAGIEPEAIVIRPVPHKKDSKSEWRDESTPGIIISPARTINYAGGYNSHDYVHYPVLIQIVDRCDDRSNDDKLESWLCWEEEIAKYFHNQNARQAAWSSDGYLFHTWVEKTDVMEEQKWDFHKHMVMAVSITGQSLNPRNSEGSV